jgi:hypothetical protein
MTILVPNVIDADTFQIQAAVDESSPIGDRFTWKRVDGNDIGGVVVAAEPSLRFPKELAGPGTSVALAAIDKAASADDVDAWTTAARIWLDYTENWFKVASDDVWKQLEWAGAVRPEELAPNRKSLVNGRTFGALEILSLQGVTPSFATWPGYFADLRTAIPSMRVSQAIVAQIALRSITWTWQSLISGGDSESPATLADTCDLAKAWKKTPTEKCSKRPDARPSSPTPAPSPWGLRLAYAMAAGGAAAALSYAVAALVRRRSHS